jgi:hypothetical protein
MVIKTISAMCIKGKTSNAKCCCRAYEDFARSSSLNENDTVNIVTCMRVTIDGVWIGNWIY